MRVVFGLDATQFPGSRLPPDSASLDGFTNNVDRLTVGTGYARGTRGRAGGRPGRRARRC